MSSKELIGPAEEEVSGQYRQGVDPQRVGAGAGLARIRLVNDIVMD